ncbi:PAS domain-containing protein [Hymenobacter jeollabukensis]|nr:PAS domain-containing protein [Hymenobacter jeollabukensis]
MPASLDYHRLFHRLPGNFLLLAADGTVLDNSDAHQRVSMLPREQGIGRSIFEAYPSAPESQRELFESQEEVRRTLRPHTMALLRYDLERPAAQGGGTEVRYWQLTHHPILDDDGQLLYILQTPEDVTEQQLARQQNQQMQQALAEAQAQAQFVLEALPVMVWTTRPDGHADYFNARWRQFTGYDLLDQSMEQTATTLVHPDDAPALSAAWTQALAGHDVFQAEYRLRRHDGQYRWVLARAVPRRNDAGHTTMWVGSATDIHDQKQLVQELLAASEQHAALSDQAYATQQQAVAQRETFLQLFQQAPALIAIVRGPEHRFEFVNERYQQTLFPGRQLLGRPVAEAIPEAAEQGFQQLIDQVYQTGEPYYGKEVPLTVDNAAEPIYLNFVYQPFRENGQVVGLFCFAFDVTELVRARQVLERLHGAGPAAHSGA